MSLAKTELILASASLARRALLRRLGVKFSVRVPRYREENPDSGHPAKVVRRHALMKARDVAGRLRRGIVVACDTLIAQDGRVFGKPKNLKDATAMLLRLSSHPHDLYTGIAIVDAKTGREMAGVEKTRVVMDQLSRAQIRRYFRKVSPLDKAGAFDIQGRGAMFIRRIEGCYFNVVGLPVRRMQSMLKTWGISLLSFLCLVIGGCSTEYNVATQKQDVMFYSTEKEVRIGDSAAQSIEREYTVIQDPEMNERLLRVGERIAAVCDRQEILYRFRIIEDASKKDLVNAVSLPGGYIYVFKQLMKEASTDDELAAVLAHEVAHIVARHSIKRLQAIWGYNLLTVVAMGTGDSDVIQGSQMAYALMMMEYSQQDELVSDRLGARYAERAGYNPAAMIDFLKKLRAIDKKEGPRPLTYFRTHPYVSQRIRATKEEIGESVSFEDYLNTM